MGQRHECCVYKPSSERASEWILAPRSTRLIVTSKKQMLFPCILQKNHKVEQHAWHFNELQSVFVNRSLFH